MGLVASMPWRRKDEVRFRQSFPQCLVLKRNCSAAAFSLRNHPVDIAYADPVGMSGDTPFGMIMSFGPGPVGSKRTERDVFNIKRFVDTVAVRNRRNRSANPSLHVHIFLQR